MSTRRNNTPPPNVGDLNAALGRRFQNPAAPAPAPEPEPPRRRSGEPAGMVRRTYYYSRAGADALAEAVDRIHHDTRGRVPKHQALDEIIRAGVAHLDEILARHSDT